MNRGPEAPDEVRRDLLKTLDIPLLKCGSESVGASEAA